MNVFINKTLINKVVKFFVKKLFSLIIAIWINQLENYNLASKEVPLKLNCPLFRISEISNLYTVETNRNSLKKEILRIVKKFDILIALGANIFL